MSKKIETKQKRIKKVFSSSFDVIHLWANQSQTDARQSGTQTRDGRSIVSRCFFEGNSLYSYGRHYELGRLVTINKKTVALINSERYSNTTSKHRSETRSAASHIPCIDVDESFDWTRGLLKMQSELVAALFDIFNGRSYSSYSLDADAYMWRTNEITAFNTTCDAVGMRHLKLEVPNEFKDLVRAHIQRCIDRAEVLKIGQTDRQTKYQAQRTAKVERVAAERVLKDQAETTAWFQGTGPLTNAVRSLKPQAIRVQDTIVQTTGGATVSLSEARQALMQLLAGRLAPNTSIGSFKFNSFDGVVATIGCHRIDVAQAAKALGFEIGGAKRQA